MSETDVLQAPSSSDWLRNTLRSALACDPVVVANEAALLTRLLQNRLERIAEVDERVKRGAAARR